MAHSVQLHASFEKNIDRLDLRVQDGIGSIVKSLESDVYFEPDEENYLFDRDLSEGVCSCRHINDWGDWQITWFYEYSGDLPTAVESIIVMLVQQPLQVL